MTKRYCLMNYTVQCTDANSGETGCFIFDADKYRTEGKFYATSPVYRDLVALFQSPDYALLKGQYLEYEGPANP